MRFFIGYLLYERTLVSALVMVAIIGVVRSWLLVPQPLVIIEDISIEKFASAYGIFGVIMGLVTLVCGAIVGKRDKETVYLNFRRKISSDF